MPEYFYRAKTLNGQTIAGSMKAKSQQELAKILHREGFILIGAKTKDKKRLIGVFSRISFLERVSLTEKMMFIRNLRVMVAAGVSLPRSLKILSNQTKSKKFGRVILKIRNSIIEGEPFSLAISRYPAVFSDIFVGMIKIGEETGTLEGALEILSKHIEKEYQLKSKIKSAMVYPAVIILAMTAIGIVMLIVVIPRLSEVFSDLGVELPLTTRMVIAFGNFLANFWYILPIIVLIIVFALRFFLKTKTGKIIINTISLKAPLVNSLTKKINSAYAIRTLSSLISAGISLVRALEIVSNSSSNIYYKRAAKEASEKIKKGAKLAAALGEHKGIYPSLVIQMIEVGEETGETSSILEKLSEFFEEEVSTITKSLSSIIEPILMLIIGAAVAFFAISMVQPIYGMMESL